MSKVLGIVFILFFLFLPRSAFAVTIASQTESFSDQMVTHRVLQELGNNLSGIASSFTFRVSTSKTNLNQFDYTIQNTRIFDKDNNNSSIVACAPPGYNPADPLGGLTFKTNGVPAGFEDVTIDFSCQNYTFIPGHRYLIVFASANYNEGSGLMYLAAAAYGSGGTSGSTDQFSEGGLRYSNGNKFDISHNSGSCSGISYVWNDPTVNPSSGCNIWTTAKDDLYFILTNTSPPPPPPKTPVIFIPGIGGSELKASQDIIWSASDNHGGTYSHAYGNNEKIWVNQDEATKLGDDDYFDVLRLKTDGVTAEANLSLTGNLTSFGYGDIDSFFTGLGYVKGTNFFVFPYDWRKDVRSTKDSLDNLVEEAKTKSGQTKVNIVAHSMGGLLARYYISDSSKAAKVNKLIELGVPHLGAPFALKTLMYGTAISYRFKFFTFPILPSSEIKDIFQNLSSGFQLIPSNRYFNFYNNSDKAQPYPFRDDRDIDANSVTGVLNYDQTKSLLSNLSFNMTTFGISEQFHNTADPILNQTNGVTIYEIVGTAQPTLGQIHETWWITWPVNLINKTEEIFINGDDTIPLYSASLKNDSLDISGATKIYYVEQSHSALVSNNGVGMQTVKSILETLDLPVEVKSQKIDLEGQQISLDDGELELYDDTGKHTGLNDNKEIETNIPETFYSTSGKVKHAFVKKKAAKVKVKVTRKSKSSSDPKYTNIKIRTYKQDKVFKTIIYKDLPISNQTSKIEFTLDPAADTTPTLTFYPDPTKPDNTTINLTSEVSGTTALDQTPPITKIDLSGTKNSSGIYTGTVTVTLTGTDSESGILRIEYSLDNGVTVQTYATSFSVTAIGKTTLQVKSIDKVGNEEVPQTKTIEIEATSSSSGSNSSSTNSSSSSDNSSSNTSSSTTTNTSKVNQSQTNLSNTSILGITFDNPSHISDQINISGMLNSNIVQTNSNILDNMSSSQILGGLLIVSGGIVALASVGLIATFTMGSSGLGFVKPFPK